MLASVAWAGSTNHAAIVPDHPAADTVTVELGLLRVGENRQHVFVFTNTTDRMLTVMKEETSCECLTVLSYPAELPPGAAGELLVNVFGEKAGDFAFAAALEFDDQSQRYFIANVRVESVGPASATSVVESLARSLPPAGVIQRAILARDRSLYTPTADARTVVDLKSARVVDVRPAEAFAGLHIADAMNIAATDASSKPFLRQGAVLLVDEGFGSAATEAACRKLRTAGNPQCHILLGGMNAWMRAGAPVQGTGGGLCALQTISPRDYLAVRGFDDWVVTCTNVPVEVVGWLLPEAATLGGAVATDDWRRVLIVDADGKGLTAPAPTVQGAAVFWLDGGLAALEQEYRDIAAMKHSQTRTTDLRIVGKRWEKIRSGCGCK